MAQQSRLPRPMTVPAIAIAGVMALVAAVQAAAYWPGLMTWDAIRQYDQALSGEFDDWHPPAMEWLWRQLVPIHTGPAPMLVVQLFLYWGGFALLAGWALRERRRGLAVALAACALLPIPLALMGAVLKDCLMAGALLMATGLLAWSRPGRDAGLRVIAILLLLCAATLRFNAFFAGLPLFVALLPAGLQRTPARLAIGTIVAALALVLAIPVASRLVGAEKSGVELSLVMFDLGGITEHSGVDAFPPLPVANPVAVNHHCYSPVKWDPYSWWVDEPCPIGFYLMRDTLKARGQGFYLLWLRAIAAHPIAYAEHRLAHFNINTRFLVNDEVERPVQVESAPNDWGYRITPNPALAAVDAAALATAATPLGWPIWWLAVAFGALMLAPALPSRRIVVPLALSALLYGFDYLVFSVAAEIRYHLWTMLAALIAAVLVGGDLAQGASVSRVRLAWAVGPAVLVALLCASWRVLPVG
jgi:hypothetical protein